MTCITVTINGSVYSAAKGETLSDLLLKNGFTHSHPCGGRGICGKCRVRVDGSVELACRYVILKSVSVELIDEGEMLSESGVNTTDIEDTTDIVLDIGTTTLAMAAVNRYERTIGRVITATNPQRSLGADVISRIDYCTRHGVGEAARLIRECVCQMLAELGAGDVQTLHVAGNAAMLHIFAGENPCTMGIAPYLPVFLDERTVSAECFGIKGVVSVRLLPSVCAFIGADVVAGINYAEIPEDKYSLLVDLGTNAEVVLFSKDKIIATAAAAGPCFEGASISCGMSATNGAVYSYDGKTVKTVDNTEPRGICGTGLVDVVAYLLRRGVIDQGGYMEDEEYPIAENVFLTKADIRQYQLAKSAVKSAILSLMNKQGTDLDMIERLYISGGFAAKINIENAAATGLIPHELKDRCIAIGNSSLMGAIKSVFEGSSLEHIVHMAEYVDLSGDEFFADAFIKNMGF